LSFTRLRGVECCIKANLKLKILRGKGKARGEKDIVDKVGEHHLYTTEITRQLHVLMCCLSKNNPNERKRRTS